MHKEGIVFDISRGSIHDGPGIRTTVFLKGCPLKCKWCHNPESQNMKPQLSFVKDRCIQCGKCESVCPEKVHGFTGRIHNVKYCNCHLNGKCIKVCPIEALSIIGRKMTSDEVMKEVLKDKKFYQKSGGGLTVSGGEPTAQHEFLVELLEKARDEKVSTCVETCGHAEQDVFRELLPLVDYFLYDYKLADSKKHKEYTGVTNERILSNLEYIYNNGAKIILRCPVIPGVNNEDYYFLNIAEIMKHYPQILEIHLMAYNNWGNSKNKNIGNYQFFETSIPDDEEKNEWIKRLTTLGCERVKIG